MSEEINEHVRISDVQVGKGFKMMLFGEPGTEKTRTLGTSKNILIIRPPTDQLGSIEDKTGVKQIVVQDWHDMNETFSWGQQGGFEPYDWVGLDSISLFQDHGLDDVFQDAVDRKPERAEYGPDKGEYGINMRRLSKWVRDMYGLSDRGMFNFFLTAHAEYWEHPITGELILAPWIQGKGMVSKITGYMNLVGYMSKEVKDDGSKQVIMYTESPGFYGKDQFHVADQLKSGRRGIINPTMGKIEQAIKAAAGPSEKTARKSRKRAASPRRRVAK